MTDQSNAYKSRIIEGEQDFQSGDYEKALELFESVLQEDPDNVEALNDAGVVYSQLGKTDRAIEKFQRVLELQPSNEDAFFNLVDNYTNKDDLPSVQRAFKAYSKHIPDSELKQKYVAVLGMNGNAKVEDELQVKIESAAQLFQDGDLNGAKQSFEALNDEHPGTPEILNDLGVLAANEEKYQQAFSYLTEAFIISGGDAGSRQNFLDLVQVDECKPILYASLEKYAAEPSPGKEKRKFIRFLTKILQAKTPYRASIRNLNITPEVSEEKPLLLQGYATGPRRATQALSPLSMQLLMLEDEHFEKLLIVTADLFGFDDAMVAKIREILEPWGIPAESIILNASHTHYAPGTVDGLPELLGPYYEKFASLIVQAIAQQLEPLYEDLQPCHIYAGSTTAQIGVNRRIPQNGTVEFGPNPEGFYPERTPVLMVSLVNDEKDVVLVNHGCHPTGLGAANVLFADYPIYVREFLKKQPDIAEVMFLQGAAGDVKEANLNARDVRFTQKPEEVAQNGKVLADHVISVVEDSLQKVSGTFTAGIEAAHIPYQDVDVMEEIAQVRETGNSPSLQTQWADAIEAMNGAASDDKFSMELQAVSIGESVQLLTFPGEPVGELAEAILSKTNLPGIQFFLGYTNGLKAYLPSAKQVEEGGYEADSAKYVYNHPAPFDTTIEKHLIQTTKDLQKRTISERADAQQFSKLLEKSPAFFTLSSGRCGTKTLSHILNTATNAEVYHHPRPYLINQTLQAYHNNIDTLDTFWSARRSVIHAAWQKGQVFGELDHNMTPFAPVIAEEIPQSKFLVLVRNPWDFVRSGMRRNYYNGHPWDSGRLRPEPTHKYFERWQSMSQFEKVCWLWNETYLRINTYLQDVPEDRYKVVKFEELVKGPEETQEIFEFLGLEGFDPSQVQNLLDTPMNKQRVGDFPRVEEWGDEMYSSLEHICSTSISIFGYETFFNGGLKTDLNLKNAHQNEFEIPTLGSFKITGSSSFNFITQDGRKTISITKYGVDTEGYPYLEWDGKTVLYGLKNAGLSPIVRKQIPTGMLNHIPAYAIAIVIDILERYYKQKQHFFYRYKPGDTVVELGAYLGYYSLFTAKQVGESGKVLAVECMPEQYQVLRKNLAENFPATAEAEHVGVWNNDGTKDVFTGGNQLNGFRKDVIEEFTTDIDTVTIPVATIDTILSKQDIDEVDLLILQLNGNELDALEGLDLTKRRIHNFAIAANYTIDGKPATEPLSVYLSAQGYEIFIANKWVYARKSKVRISQVEQLKDPIFIGGCGRSGTTLLRVMLDSHKNIACGPESALLITNDFGSADLGFKFDLPIGIIQLLANQSANKVEFINQFFSLYAMERGKSRWAEKTPRNVYALDFIFDQFSDAKFIHVIRDGRDVVNSLRTHPRYRVVDGERVPTNIFRPLEPCIGRWLNDTQQGLTGRKYRGYYEVRYEDLVYNPEPTFRELLEFLGEPWDANVLDFYQEKKASRNVLKFPQNVEATKRINTKRVQRWVTEFTPEDAQTFEELAGELLRKLGYARDDSWLEEVQPEKINVGEN